MDSGKIVIYGSGAVGRGLAKDLGRAVQIRSRSDTEQIAPPEIALVCWPAHSMKDLESTFPELYGSGTRIVSFCNGVWAKDDADVEEEGICYTRFENDGSGGPGTWRVASKETSILLRGLGANVTASVDHRPYVFGKALYLLPLALACAELGRTAREVAGTPAWHKWYGALKSVAEAEVGDRLVPQITRMNWLLGRLPRHWTPSPTREELDYFKRSLEVIG